jgi:DNA-binding SARP family transcriptional activator
VSVEPPTGTSPVRFEVLGPLRAWREDAELDLGPGKQRSVLAVLLLNANRTTTTAKIIDAVWGEDPPENGANVVHKYVAGLRRALEPGRSPRAPSQVLTRTDAGYVLHVPPGRLDTDVFHDRVAQAQAARSAGRPAEAAGQFRAALALWRDQVLAGMHGTFFDAARERFAEDRATALEAYAEVDLDLGHHARLVPELVRLTAEFPLREQLRYLLILALYRCGRQAEALAAFREARQFLTEEYGVEPGERLQRLHLAVLRSDPALTPDPPGPDRTTVAPADGRSPAADPAPVLLPPAPDVVRPVPTGPPAAAGPPPVMPVSPMPPGPRRRRRSWTVRLIAIVIPLLTFGLCSWAVIGYVAARRRSRALAAAAAGYFGLVVVFALASSSDASSDSPQEAVAVLAMLAAMAGGAAHAALIAHDPGQSSSRHRNPDDTRSMERRVRREQALTLVEHHPAIARELRIGRPDLLRVFDDGGLIDINAVPEHILATLPGVTPLQAHHIVVRRQARGGFDSVDDLIAEGLLPTTSVHAHRDVLTVVAAPVPPPHAPAPPVREAGMRHRSGAAGPRARTLDTASPPRGELLYGTDD